MPDILRAPTRMNCNGIDLVHPPDRMPPDYFPYLSNARVVEEGRIESRPGYSSFVPGPLPITALHSIRRLNDAAKVYSPDGYTYVVGDDSTLFSGKETNLGQVDTGYSGDPLSLIPFRPANSAAAWMYVFDRLKNSKVRADGQVRTVGAAPASAAPAAEYGRPAMATITDGALVTGWVPYGGASGGATQDRPNSSAPTITSIQYIAGTTGWAILAPNLNGQSFWTGERMRVILNTGGGNAETVLVREIHPAIVATTIDAIQYDSGSTGMCSLVLLNSPVGLARNSLIHIGSETIRVLAVILSPDGHSYSVRCSTTASHAAGNAVTGLVSWYVYTVQTHAAAETITLKNVGFSFASSGTGAAALLTSIDASSTNIGRPISIADDWMHISLFLQNPGNVTEIDLMIDIDAGTTTIGGSGNAFTRNFYTWKITPAQLNFGSGGNTWTEILVPLAAGIRSGNDLTRTLANIKAIQVQLVTTGACAFGFDCWYLSGTYGPMVQPNSPTGLLYEVVNRDSETGAASLPSPITRYELFPLRELIIVTPQTSTILGINSFDIYRQGGTLSNFTYVGTVPNNPASPFSFNDSQSDATIQANPSPDLSLVQPWPVSDTAWAGIVNVIGTSVTWVSGTKFNVNLLANTVFTINGVAYQTYGQPHSDTFLELTSSAYPEVGFGVNYAVAQPTLAGQPLPYAFGPLEGPFAPVIFALGDLKNAGTLYFSNGSSADAASDQNTLELCSPSEPLVSGQVWNGIAIVGSRDDLFVVRYSYLATIGASSNLSYQFAKIPSPSGMWSRWASCVGPDGVYYLGRDGVYRATEQGAVNVSDDLLYPLFPHDGHPATGTPDLAPVDMTQLTQMRMTAADQDIYFDYLDTNGNQQTLRLDVKRKRWFPHTYADSIVTHYMTELPGGIEFFQPANQQILLLSRVMGLIYVSGGDTDNSIDIQTIVQTPSFDAGDERAQKLYIDAMLDLDGLGSMQSCVQFNNQSIGAPWQNFMLIGQRQQFVQTIDYLPTSPSQPGMPSVGPAPTPLGLALYRNISVRLMWTGGPSGPRAYAFEPTYYAQPYLSKFIATQFLNLSFPGWKHHRRLYAGLISVADTLFTIQCQDGRTFGPYKIPSTGGQFKVQPLMLDAGIKDLAFAYQLDGNGEDYALFPEAFTIETKDWSEPDYIELAVFKT